MKTHFPSIHANIRSMEHHCEIVEGLNVRSMWTAVCTCGREIGDFPEKETRRYAREHEGGIEQPWVIPKGEQREWHPGKHPIEKYKVR